MDIMIIVRIYYGLSVPTSFAEDCSITFEFNFKKSNYDFTKASTDQVYFRSH